jgi:hypothetical protein
MPNGFIQNNAGINIELAISFSPVKKSTLNECKICTYLPFNHFAYNIISRDKTKYNLAGIQSLTMNDSHRQSTFSVRETKLVKKD